MTRQIVQRAACRDHIDEAKQGGTELTIARGHVHRPSVQSADGMATAGGKRSRQLAADPLQLLLDQRIGAVHQPRMLTARATTRPIVTSAVSAWRLISHLAVGLSGMVSVGLKAVALVNDVYR